MRLSPVARRVKDGENVSGAPRQEHAVTVNQQERPPAKRRESSETIRQAPLQKRQIVQAYLFGAMHDGTVRQSDHRFRIAQKGTGWLKTIQKLVSSVGYKSWIYQEGKKRDVYVLESVALIFRESFDPYRLRTSEEKKAYVRGFFDAEGGIPRSLASKRYVQLAQKDRRKIKLLKEILAEFGIATGKIHNPSKRVDPGYWRLYVSRRSITDFVSQIGSWHPRKRAIFREWMKI